MTGIHKKDTSLDLQIKVSFLVEVAPELSLRRQSQEVVHQPYSRWIWTK